MMGMVFYGPESEHIEHAKQSDQKPHEADRWMWGACAVLAGAIVMLGLGGPYVEHLLDAAFHSDLVGRLQLPLQPAKEHPINYHLVVTVLSVLSVVLGALPAYFLYIKRKKDPRELLNKYAVLQILHAFFWRRWFIDGFYYKVFVDGMLKLSDFVAYTLEDGFDNLIHRRFPDLVTRRFHDLLVHFRTDTGVFFYNITYILIIFIGLLFFILW
jgi:NADH:ubiquinone oxidoreductase subunit 5 (subunit L)/multisubunit Na+/H+ antiporter MnhA subunit